jgi:polar amino acid transport system substrate-binding protein
VKFRPLALGLLGTCLAVARPAAADRLNIYYENNPPLEFARPPEHPTGIAPELLNLAAEKAGIEVAYHEVPWSRAMAHARSDADACAIGAGRTPEREEQFRWIGPFLTGGLSLFARSGFKTPIHAMEDVTRAGLRVGVSLDDIAAAMAAQYPQLHTVQFAHHNLAPKMLQAGRFDLWASGRTLALYQLSLAGVPVNEVLRISTVSVAMACNLKGDPGLLQRLQSAFDELVQAGKADQIRLGYLGEAGRPGGIAMLYTDRWPYIGTNKDGSVGGLLAGPSTRIFETAEIPIHWVSVPQQRILPSLANLGAHSCSPGWYWNAERAAKFRYSKPFYVDRPQMALVRAQPGIEPKMRAAELLAKPDVRVVLRANMSHGDYIDRLVAGLPPGRVQFLPTDVSSIARMVKAGHADLTFVVGDEVEKLMADLGGDAG